MSLYAAFYYGAAMVAIIVGAIACHNHYFGENDHE